MSEQQAKRFLLSGRVQGVGFRYWARQSARALGVRGWIRNLPDGSVEVQAAAAPEVLERFKEELRCGPAGAMVDAVDEQELTQMPDWQGFQIVF
ncbi:MAG TPA: acylphosphatase [Thermoanaerobaculia bacterium]|nr:acylphosphatase [Thermoanaerobaculia bacterium]